MANSKGKRGKSEDVDTYSYRGWLLSDKFHKRAFAVLGHNMAAVAAVYAAILVVAIFVLAIIWISEFYSSVVNYSPSFCSQIQKNSSHNIYSISCSNIDLFFGKSYRFFYNNCLNVKFKSLHLDAILMKLSSANYYCVSHSS